MKTSKLLICAAGVSVALASPRVHSQTLDFAVNDVLPGLIINASSNALTPDPFFQDMPAGVYVLSGGLEAFCVEPSQGLGIDPDLTLTYTIVDFTSSPLYGLISRLVGGYYASAMDDLEAAAVQMAIWEVLAETSMSWSLLDGNVMITQSGDEVDPDVLANGIAVANRASYYLDNVDFFAPASFVYLANPEYQDLILIPEPASAALLGLSAVALLRRRRVA